MARNMIAALVVRGGNIERVALAEGDTYPGIRDLIGNTITSCFEAPSDDPRRPVWGYCDDEFLLVDNPDWNVVLTDGELYRGHYAIGGPIVIVGGDVDTGESRGLTDEEAGRFWIDKNAGMVFLDHETGGVRFVPLLRYTYPNRKEAEDGRQDPAPRR